MTTLLTLSSYAQSTTPLTQQTIASRLGWVVDKDYYCGGYYLEQPFISPDPHNKAVGVTSNEVLFSQHGTSILTDKVTLTRYGQQITANKAYLYRDPINDKLLNIDMIGNVHLREPNTLIVGKKGRYNFQTGSKSLIDILYRTSLNGKHITGPKVAPEEIQQARKITGLTAWGRAYEVSQTEPQTYELSRASYTTCPPIKPAWRMKASHIVLDKNSGRGYATHARILVKNVPVFYVPYINFPIDSRRKSGFLWPTLGVGSGARNWGPYVFAPIYWNMAPNYDMTITPGLLTKRGVQLSDDFRYLTETSSGSFFLSVLPNDSVFSQFQKKAKENPPTSTLQSPEITQAETNRLLNSSTTRKAFAWRDDSRFNDHWFSHVDFNYVGDDYYLRDFGSNLNQITGNYLLQEGDLYYKSEHWDFTGRMQAYQTLHPVTENNVINQYRRFPQLILNANYPDQPLGLTYFINNEVTNFEILKTPGMEINQPIGNRLHTQPGISLPLYWPSFYINPRFQLALTDYNLSQTANTNIPNNKRRAVPIFDVASGLSFSRDATLFHHVFQQTLEPQIYYTYIPYRNQVSIPVFDTTTNTLTYDQLFNYNRFSGLDRIGDANQLGLGLTTRVIDAYSGLEKIRLGVGEIIYFATRRVTLCNNSTICSDNPTNPSNHWRLSPISGLLNYNVNRSWGFRIDTIWNPISKQMDNSTFNLHYQPDEQRIINLGYGYARGPDVLSGVQTTNAINNLKVTDVSFAWPLIPDISVVGRWNQNWNEAHLQNLLYGLQYDTCCWAVRIVGGRTFTGFDPTSNNAPKYDNPFYIQFSLKGLGATPNDPTGLLNSITGYKSQFGQDI